MKVFCDINEVYFTGWKHISYFLDFELDKFILVYDIKEADIIPTWEQSNLYELRKVILPTQVILHLEIHHAFEGQGKDDYVELIRNVMYADFVNKVVFLTTNMSAKWPSHVRYDFLFNRQKYYYENPDKIKYDRLQWTFGATPEVFKLTPIAKEPKKKFLSPSRIYFATNDKWNNRRSEFRELLRNLLATNIRAGYLNNSVGGAFFLSNEMTPTMVERMGKDNYGGGTWYPVADWYYNTSYVSIYVETIAATKGYSFITEKTFDPLIKGNFILPFGHQHLVQYIRDYGFKLPKWIDYSYDTIQNDDERFAAYLSSVKQVMVLKLDDLHTKYEEDRDILEYNRSIFTTKPYDKFHDRLVECIQSMTEQSKRIQHANETLSEYKIRVIDPISDTYCAAKWYNATIWLGHGQTTSCHHPSAHKIDVEEIKTNPSAIHNTTHKKQMRKLMLEGKRPNECEYCWKVEDIGRNNVSDRTFKTKIYNEDDITKTTQMPWDSNVELKTLEVSFERTCNFACSYCSPAFSTTWVRDIKKNGPYINVISNSRAHFMDSAPWAANATEKEEDNPYIQAFWKWWNSSLSVNLEEIRITGGEPLMAPSVWKLFEWFKDNPEKGKKLRFAINSNLVPKDALIDKLIKMSKKVPHLEIYTSNESFGAHSDYIRDGMDYYKWIDNINRLLTEGNVNGLHVMMTINSLCLASITEFMDHMIAMKQRHGVQFCTMSLNILRFPSFQSCAILPSSMKEHYKQKLEEWLIKQTTNPLVNRQGRPFLSEWEIAQVQRLIDYLDVVKTPHQHTADQDKLYSDFRSFYEQYDQRRGKDFRKTFPADFVEFVDSIKLIGGECVHGGDPATTAEGYVSDEVAHGWDTKNDTLGKNE
jgi:organic radical activating enzyme